MASETTKGTGRATEDIGEEVTVNALHNELAVELAEEFRLSDRQRREVAEYCDSYGERYVVSKAEIVRSAPRRNAAGALLAALRADWQPAASMGDSKANDDLAQRMGWVL